MDREYLDYSSEEENEEYSEQKQNINDIESFYVELKSYLESSYSSILDKLELNKFILFVKKFNKDFSHV
tara:strand:- start:516 stop:722 length:207 start_codon:yes stop_codon:yes gene_type:complete